MNKYKVLSFYKYVEVAEPESFAKEHLEWCLQNEIKGKVYVAKEGINGSIFGDEEATSKYKNHLTGYKMFEDIWFKETPTDIAAFPKMHVRVKEEIVNSHLKVDLKNTAPKLTPEQLFNFYKEGKDFIIVDVRNDYESKLGRFKNAITPQVRHFRDWPKVVESLEQFKNKTIITYCTGGIRCEKASAYMREHGFENVYQIHGGILNYIQQYPDTYWEGSMFVFDERKVVEPNTKEELKYIAQCHHCRKPASYHINCHNVECDKLIVVCYECKVKYDYCCSGDCRESEQKRKVVSG